MVGYRVTKYNPENRNSHGHYIVDEWTDYSDIGKKFENKVLLAEDYLVVENLYVLSAFNFFKNQNEDKIKFILFGKGRLNKDPLLTLGMISVYKKIKNNKEIELKELPDIMRLILRNYIGGMFVGTNSRVEFGWDYYMYFGISDYNDKLLENSIPTGMYFEKCELPEHED